MCINLFRISAKEAVLLGNNKGTQACGNSVSQTLSSATRQFLSGGVRFQHPARDRREPCAPPPAERRVTVHEETPPCEDTGAHWCNSGVVLAQHSRKKTQSVFSLVLIAMGVT